MPMAEDVPMDIYVILLMALVLNHPVNVLAVSHNSNVFMALTMLSHASKIQRSVSVFESNWKISNAPLGLQ